MPKSKYIDYYCNKKNPYCVKGDKRDHWEYHGYCYDEEPNNTNPDKFKNRSYEYLRKWCNEYNRSERCNYCHYL